MSATVSVEVPAMRKNRRPSLSSSRIATIVKKTFVQPMKTLWVSAPVFCWPANLRMVGA